MLKAGLESKLNGIWYGNNPPGIVLRSLEPIYERMFRRRQESEKREQPTDLQCKPIVVVGNITAGGTGKTPLVIRLCELLHAAGFQPGVVSRGYGRSDNGLLRVGESDSAAVTGDEPLLIHARTGAPVFVGPDRTQAARMAFAEGVEVVISDDGLQRAGFPRQYEICVIDGRRGLGNGHLLPAGPLRESADRLLTVDAVVVSQPSPRFEMPQGAVAMSLEPRNPRSVPGGQELNMDTWLTRAAGTTVVAVAGIGHPDKFFSTLRELGISFTPRAYPDHHDYTAADFAGTGNDMIIMTEKDAVKCRRLDLSDAWYLPVTARLPTSWEQRFVEHVRAMVGPSRVGS